MRDVGVECRAEIGVAIPSTTLQISLERITQRHSEVSASQQRDSKQKCKGKWQSCMSASAAALPFPTRKCYSCVPDRESGDTLTDLELSQRLKASVNCALLDVSQRHFGRINSQFRQLMAHHAVVCGAKSTTSLSKTPA